MNEAEVLELKADLEAYYKKRSEAIDIVLEMLRSKNGVSPSSATQQQPTPVPTSVSTPTPKPETTTGAEQPTRVRGILKATRALLPELPETFTSFDVRDRLEASNPKFAGGKIKMDSLRGVLKLLASEGLIEQIEEAAGPKPAVYRRVERKAEANM